MGFRKRARRVVEVTTSIGCLVADTIYVDPARLISACVVQREEMRMQRRRDDQREEDQRPDERNRHVHARRLRVPPTERACFHRALRQASCDGS